MTSCCNELYQALSTPSTAITSASGHVLVEDQHGGEPTGDRGRDEQGRPFDRAARSLARRVLTIRLYVRGHRTCCGISAHLWRVRSSRCLHDHRSTPMLRERLAVAIARSGLGKGEFAERAGVDRTTLSQLLSPDTGRLPRLDTVVALADAHDISLDWLVGRSDAGPIEAELVQHTTSFEAPGPTPADERLLGWLDDAADHKIRYVPATLPDLLKTDAVIHYERAGSIDRVAVHEIDTTAARLAWARNPDTEMECCSTVQSLRAFASGDGSSPASTGPPGAGSSST